VESDISRLRGRRVVPATAPKDHPCARCASRDDPAHLGHEPVRADRYAAGVREILECYFEDRRSATNISSYRRQVAGVGAHSYSEGMLRGSEEPLASPRSDAFRKLRKEAGSLKLPVSLMRNVPPMRRDSRMRNEQPAEQLDEQVEVTEKIVATKSRPKIEVADIALASAAARSG